MNKDSLFAILLRSPWRISIAAAGEITDNARAFAVEKNIRLVHDAELVKLLPQPKHR